MSDLQNEVMQVLSKIHEQKTFHSAEEFYDFLKTQGMTITLDDVKSLLIDMRNAKVELSFDEIEDVTGGAQVEIVNNIKDNKNPVKIGPSVVIQM